MFGNYGEGSDVYCLAELFFLTIFGDTNNYLGVCMCDLKKGDSQIFYKGGG